MTHPPAPGVGRQRFNRPLMTTALAVTALLANGAIALAGHDHLLPGIDFTDPSSVVEMEAGWESRPIERSDWAQGADLAVTLDQHLYPALLPMIQQFGRRHGIEIAVQEGTCGISAGQLIDRKADIGGFCCPASESDRLPGLRYHTLGIAALALLVEPGLPIDSLTLHQARSIFSGDLRSLTITTADGTAPVPIQPIGRLHCKTRPGHWRLLLDNEDLFSPLLEEVSTIPDMIASVATTQGAIGYEVSWMVERFDQRRLVRKLKIDGVSPDDNEALIRGRYPLFRTYQITTWERPPAASPLARRLVDHLMTSIDQIDPAYGIVPAHRLREAKWQFERNELTGTPPL